MGVLAMCLHVSTCLVSVIHARESRVLVFNIDCGKQKKLVMSLLRRFFCQQGVMM